jgi:hypothetical protein
VHLLEACLLITRGCRSRQILRRYCTPYPSTLTRWCSLISSKYFLSTSSWNGASSFTATCLIASLHAVTVVFCCAPYISHDTCISLPLCSIHISHAPWISLHRRLVRRFVLSYHLCKLSRCRLTRRFKSICTLHNSSRRRLVRCCGVEKCTVLHNWNRCRLTRHRGFDCAFLNNSSRQLLPPLWPAPLVVVYFTTIRFNRPVGSTFVQPI